MVTSMDSLPWSSKLENIQRGVDKVIEENGNFALLADSPVVEHYIKHDCRLMQFGSTSSSRSYGIALPKGL